MPTSSSIPADKEWRIAFRKASIETKALQRRGVPSLCSRPVLAGRQSPSDDQHGNRASKQIAECVFCARQRAHNSETCGKGQLYRESCRRSRAPASNKRARGFVVRDYDARTCALTRATMMFTITSTENNVWRSIIGPAVGASAADRMRRALGDRRRGYVQQRVSWRAKARSTRVTSKGRAALLAATHMTALSIPPGGATCLRMTAAIGAPEQEETT